MWPSFDPWQSLAVAADVAAATQAPARAIAERQARRLSALFEAAARGSRLYRERLPADWRQARLQDLAPVTKRELMQRFGDWVADPALTLHGLREFMADSGRIGQDHLGRYTVWESSGSSGEPGVYVQDPAAMAVYDALESLRRPSASLWRRMFDPWLLGERIAFVGATGGHFASTVSIERLRRLNPAFAERVHGVSFLQPPEALLAEIEALQPTVVATYPTAAVLLAIERIAGRTSLAPREIWTGGETLTPAMRRFIMQAFGCTVVNSYGASECLAMASECSRGQMHLNADWVILEPVDERGRPVPPGQPSASCWLTNLANRVQPLIRYDLGDRITLRAGACRCGSALPMIEVQGRCDDMLRLPRSGRSPLGVLPLAVSTVLEDEAGLFDFQLRQTAAAELQLCTGLRGGEARAALRRGRAALAAWLADQGAGQVRIRCRSGEPGWRGRSGKIPRVLAAPGGPLRAAAPQRPARGRREAPPGPRSHVSARKG